MAIHTAHHPKLQHHFDDMEQQAEASTLGMWVFLVTEIMFFGGLVLGLHGLPPPREPMVASRKPAPPPRRQARPPSTRLF